MARPAEQLHADPLLHRAPVLEGFKVLDPAVLYAKIGTGGMGAVYRGRHLNLDCDVAVKVLKSDLAEDEQFVFRFEREARMAARIKNDNVVQVLDVRQREGIHYLVMEFVKGETARERVLRKGRLSEAEAMAIFVGVARGLRAAHAEGIVHRDIKPENILVAADGAVKLADLGLAKLGSGRSEQSRPMRSTGIMGTPLFMPPEQWRSTAVTAAADIWALGATMWYLLAGRSAIDDGELLEIADQIRDREFPDITMERPDLRPETRAVIARCTRRAPEERFRDARELLKTLSPLVDHAEDVLADAQSGTVHPRSNVITPPPRSTLARIRDEIERDPARTQLFPGAMLPSEQPTRASRPPLTTRSKGWLVASMLCLVAGGGTAYARGWFDITTPASPAEQPSLLSQGMELLKEDGYFDAAIAALEAALSQDPGSKAARQGLVRALVRKVQALERTDAPSAYAAAQRAWAVLPDAGSDGSEMAPIRAALQRRLAQSVLVTTPAPDAILGDKRIRIAGEIGVSDLRAFRVALVPPESLGAAFPRQLAQSIVHQDGRFDLVASAPADGDWILRFELVDDRGLSAEAAVRTVCVDTTAPTLVIMSPTHDRIATRVTLSGTAVDASATTVAVNGDAASRDSDGAWSFDLQLPAGSHDITIVARDAAGNEARSTRRLFAVDRAPVIRIGESTPAVSKQLEVDVSGQIDDPSSISLVCDGTPVLVAADGTFTARVSLREEGRNEVELVARDVVGTEARQTCTIHRDTEIPDLAIHLPADGIVPSGPLVVTGTIRDKSPSRVWVGQVEARVTGDAWTITLTPGTGTTVIAARALDAAGNESTLVRTVRVEPPPANLDWATIEPDSTTVEIEGKRYPSIVRIKNTSIRMRLIGAMTDGFTMGSPDTEPGREADELAHLVRIRRAFWLGETEVTQAEWLDVIRDNPSRNQGAELPVESASWEECVAFLRSLDRSLEQGAQPFRLPSEAEWEYACRAGSQTPFAIDEARIHQGAANPSAARTSPANPWGLHEMHGNVWEWCSDVWGDYPGSGTEQPTRGDGPRILRGGSWRGSRDFCRSANRFWAQPWERRDDVGFRIARDL